MSFKEVDPPVSRSQSAVKAIVYAVVILLILASLSYGAVLYPTDETGFVMAFAVVVALSFALVAHYAFEKVSIACIPIFPVIASTSFAALTGQDVWVGFAAGSAASVVAMVVGAVIILHVLEAKVEPGASEEL